MPKPSPSQCWDLQRWAAAEGSYKAESITSDPVQRFIIVILLSSVLPSCQVQLSSGKHKTTSVQGSLLPLQFQENNKADISAAEKSSSAWAAPLNQALNQYENQAQLFFAKTFFFFFFHKSKNTSVCLWTTAKLSSNCSLSFLENQSCLCGVSY